MFSVTGYINELTVSEDDEELQRAVDHVKLTELICDDAWLVRQAHYGLAGAMERQIEYLGGTLLPNTESRIQRLNGEGVSGESYVADNWFGTTNADSPHVNDENPEQAVDDAQTFAEGLRKRMRSAAIIFVTHVRAHDEVSKMLEQFTYGQIKQKAAQNRKAAAKAA